MFVRLALEEDIDAVCEMARMNIQETRPEIGYDDYKARETFHNYLDKASPTVFVVEDNGTVIAFLMAEMYGYRASEGIFTVQEVLFVRPDKRGTRASVLLMKALVDWSKTLGAREIVGGNDNSFKSARTAKFLEHFGFERVGYAMRRSDV